MNSPDDLFLGLTIEGWTAVLVVVTALYATITLWLAVSASRSARSAERAAKAAEDTAETAERSALASEEAASASEKAALAAAKSAELAEARIDVSLAARYEERGGTQPWLRLVCEGDRVVIHGARTQGSYFGRSSGRPHSMEPKDLEWFHPDHGPCALRKGEHVLFEWPGEPVNLQDHHAMAVRIFYSILADDQPDSTLVEVVFPHGGEDM